MSDRLCGTAVRSVGMAPVRCWSWGGPEDTDGTSGTPSGGLEQKPELRGACRRGPQGCRPAGAGQPPPARAAGRVRSDSSHHHSRPGATLDQLEGPTHTSRDISFPAGKPCSVFLMKLQATERRGGGKGERREAFSALRTGALWAPLVHVAVLCCLRLRTLGHCCQGVRAWGSISMMLVTRTAKLSGPQLGFRSWCHMVPSPAILPCSHAWQFSHPA